MARSITRTLSFFSTWLAEVVRQPALMLSLVIGPFLILLAFGEGAKLGVPRPRTIVVEPQTQGQQRIQPLPAELDKHLDVVGETRDLKQARADLVNGNADLVAVLPPDPIEAVKRGEHAPIQILTNEIDPVRKSYARIYLDEQIATLNQQALEKAIGDAQQPLTEMQTLVGRGHQYVRAMRSAQGDVAKIQAQARDLRQIIQPLSAATDRAATATRGIDFVIPGLGRPADQVSRLAQSVDALKRGVDQLDARLVSTTGGAAAPSADELTQIDARLSEIDATIADIKTIPPDVLSAPFQLDVENVAPFVPTYIGFYAPAVLALLLQHLAVTLGALSMARVRLLGLMELFQTSPVRPAEVVAGNYLSYGTLCALAAALLAGLLLFALGVPMFGSALAFVAILGLLILCSLGIGFVISMISSSEQQAAQIAMLVLIASVFFSGFIVSLDTLSGPVHLLSYLLPATYAIRSLQDVMLRGLLRSPADLAVLGAAAVAFFVVTVQLFRREFRPA